MKKIMFSDAYELTEAVLSGRKTQTRRIVKRNQLFKRDPDGVWTDDEKKAWGKSGIYESDFRNDEDMRNAFEWLKAHAPYKVGEVVAVAQSYASIVDELETPKNFCCMEHWESAAPKRAHYCSFLYHPGMTNKMFVSADEMPHQIRITNVRVERLQDISDEDCFAEGIIKGKVGSEDTHFMAAYYAPNVPLEPCVLPQGAYALLIDRISGKGTWESNPYVFVYDFELVK